MTEFTIGGRTYELVPILEEGERYISGDTMVERAKELNANLGEEDGRFILEHQDEIPQEYQGKFFLIFAGWRNPSYPQDFGYLGWGGDPGYRDWDGRWGWSWLTGHQREYCLGWCRLVRRKT